MRGAWRSCAVLLAHRLLRRILGARPGQLRDPGLRRRHGRAADPDGRAALELHRRRPKARPSTASTRPITRNTRRWSSPQGLNDWSEVGFYIFTSEQDGHGVQWVGDHIRPRVRVPDSWHWPVGVSLSTEVGYQRAVYSPDTWTWEIRPIIDKSDRALVFRGQSRLSSAPFMAPTSNQGFQLAPGVKVATTSPSRERRRRVLRRLRRDRQLLSLHNQQQQIFVVTDLNVSPKWEINIGVGMAPPPPPTT